MSSVPESERSALDQLERFAKSIQGMSDSELCEQCRRPETRANLIEVRASIQPWLRAFSQIASVDGRLAKALKRTAQERRA